MFTSFGGMQNKKKLVLGILTFSLHYIRRVLMYFDDQVTLFVSVTFNVYHLLPSTSLVFLDCHVTFHCHFVLVCSSSLLSCLFWIGMKNNADTFLCALIDIKQSLGCLKLIYTTCLMKEFANLFFCLCPYVYAEFLVLNQTHTTFCEKGVKYLLSVTAMYSMKSVTH